MTTSHLRPEEPLFLGHLPTRRTLVGLVNQGILAGRFDTANHPSTVARRVQSQAAFQAESDAHLPANVAARLAAMAQNMPEATAVVEPLGYDRLGKRQYRKVTFRELDEDSSRIAQGLCRMGATPGTRLALLVRPGIDFVALVFALLRAGAVVILIDPGMGRKNLLRCLADAEPEGFVAIPVVQAMRALTAPPLSQEPFPRHRRPPLVLGRHDARGASRRLRAIRRARGRPGPPIPNPQSHSPPLVAAPGTACRRPGRDHLHHRQHRPAQGRALYPWQF